MLNSIPDAANAAVRPGGQTILHVSSAHQCGETDMTSFAEYEEGYKHNWANLKIRENRREEARDQANHLLHGKATYQKIETKTEVPWWFVGLCHYRESTFNFDTYLGNGQRLAKVTTEVPKGRG